MESLHRAHAGRSQVLSVAQLMRGYAASAERLKEGDLLLAVDSVPVTSTQPGLVVGVVTGGLASLVVVVLVARPSPSSQVCTYRDVEELVGCKGSVDVAVLRDGEVTLLPAVPTEAIDGVGTARVVLWAGLVLQEPHRGQFPSDDHLEGA